MTLEVGLAPDLENWILGWGSHAEVIEAGQAAEPVISDLLARVVGAL